MAIWCDIEPRFGSSELIRNTLAYPANYVSLVQWEYLVVSTVTAAGCIQYVSRMVSLLSAGLSRMWGCFLLDKTIDVLLYVDRLDAYRVDNLDRQIIKAITDSFGKAIWKRAAVVLTHAQLSPPDGLSYEEFFSKRSEALLKVVRLGGRIKKQDSVAFSMPVVLVENSGRCNKNESGEKILPNGVSWIPNMVKTIIDVISNGSKGILVDKKLIEGPNPNARHKMWIPVILAFQYFIVKQIRGAIQKDIAREPKAAWELRDMNVSKRKY
ncbi:Translocase of chloroplast 34 [Bienertia sinuspersici]